MEVNDQQDIENIEFDVIDFKVFKKKTGKVSHQYTINDQPFLHHKVQKVVKPILSVQNHCARQLYIFDIQVLKLHKLRKSLLLKGEGFCINRNGNVCIKLFTI